MFIEDYELLHKHLPEFKKIFPVEIKSRSIIPEDEFTEHIGDPDDLFEVELEMNNMNNFWYMAQQIGEIKYKTRINGSEL